MLLITANRFSRALAEVTADRAGVLAVEHFLERRVLGHLLDRGGNPLSPEMNVSS
jgi:hypothetical protein